MAFGSSLLVLGFGSWPVALNPLFNLMQSESKKSLLRSDLFFSPRLCASAVGFVFNNLFHQRIRITLMLCYFGGEARNLIFRQALAQKPLQQAVAQHFNQPLAPVRDLLL